MHKPLPINAYDVEPVETVINPRQVRPVCKSFLLQHLLVFTELLQTNRATTMQRVILLRQNLPELFVNVVDHLFLFLRLMAVLLQTTRDLLP